MASELQRYRQQQQPSNNTGITMTDDLDNSILSGAASGIGLGHNSSRLSYGDMVENYDYDHGDFERTSSAGKVANWMNLTINDAGNPNDTSMRSSVPSHPLFGHLLEEDNIISNNNDDFERRFNEAATPTGSSDDDSATSFDSTGSSHTGNSQHSQSTRSSTPRGGFWDELVDHIRPTETFNTTFTHTEDEDEEDGTVSAGSLEDKQGDKTDGAGTSARTSSLSSSYQKMFGMDRPILTQSQFTNKEREDKQLSSITDSCRLPLSSVLPTTTTDAPFTLNTATTTPTSRNHNKDTAAASDCSRPFDESAAAANKVTSLLDSSRQICKQERPKPVPPRTAPTHHKGTTTGSSRRKRDPLGSKAIDNQHSSDLNDNNTAAPLDELQDDATAKQRQRRQNSTRGGKSAGNDVDQQLLCVYICVDPNCPRGKQCQPPDIVQEAKNMKKTVKDPSFFYVPVSLILSREADMRQAAKQTKVPRNRWNGSLLFQKWQEQEELKQQQQRQRNNKNNDREDDSTTTSGFVKILNCTLHPVQDLAQAHVVSPHFPWWQSWLTVCIRAYYNTGTIRIPKDCHGLEILLALEFLGILYGSPDQLVFDEPAVYQKVKHWSRYFTYRASLAKWVVDTLKEKQLEEQQQQQQEGNGNNKKYPGPFVFCTHPKSVKPGWKFTIEPLDKSIIIFEGGLQLEDPAEIGSSKKHRRKKRSSSLLTSEQLVHEFFVPNPKEGPPLEGEGAEDDLILSSPEMVPGMMRDDFKSYLQHVLPEVELTFAIKEIPLVSNHVVMGRNKKKFHGAARRAVLVVSFGPRPAITQHRRPQNGDIKKARDPKDWSKAAKDEGKPSPDRREFSSAASCVSVATGISDAPTDERAFGNLLETTHKAVVKMLEHTTNEKLIGDCGGRDEFYFHKQGPNNTDKKVSTPDTTGSSEVSLMLEEPPVTYRSQGELAPNVLFPMSRVQDKKTGGRNDIELAKGGVPDHGMSKPSKLKQQPSNAGYGPSALDTSHIYGGELLLDSLFPHPATPNLDLKHSGTGVSQQSPLWTPSLVTQETTPGPAPLPFVNSDNVSVTSSITRQPDSVGNVQVNVQDTTKPQLREESRVAVAAKYNEPSNCAPDRQSKAMTCGDLFAPKKDLDEDETSGVEKLHDESFEKRFQEFMSDDGEPYKTARLKQKKKKRMKKNLQAALDDLKFGVSAKDLDEIRRAASGAEPNVESCQFLNDMFEVFLPSAKKPNDKGCDDGTSCMPSRRSPDTTLDSATLDSDGSAWTWSRSKRYPAAEAIGVTEESISSATLFLQMLAGQKAPYMGPTERQKAPTVPTEISSPVRKASASNVAHIEKPFVPSVIRAAVDNADADDETSTGIEVYHIPRVAPTPETQLLTRPKARLPSKAASGRERTHPPRNPNSPPPSSVVPPRGGKRSASKRHDATNTTKKDEKKNKKLFGFLRKK